MQQKGTKKHIRHQTTEISTKLSPSLYHFSNFQLAHTHTTHTTTAVSLAFAFALSAKPSALLVLHITPHQPFDT